MYSSISEKITAKWKSSFDEDERYFGTVNLGEDRIHFPILDSDKEIPSGISLLWGLTDKLEKCTALTSRVHSHATCSGPSGTLYSKEIFLNRLLVGRNYVSDPSTAFVKEIFFTPLPNKQLFVRGMFEAIMPSKDIAGIEFSPSCTPRAKKFADANLAYFKTERGTVFETSVASAKATFSAAIWGSHSFALENVQSRIVFKIAFDAPCTLETAADEASQLCAFLSFITHQYVYPADFHIKASDEDEVYKFYHAGIRSVAKDEKKWVRHTLVIPEENPDKFCELLQKWYKDIDDKLRGRYLYRSSFEEPNSFSQDRYLAVFQAIEGIIPQSGYQLMTDDELKALEATLTQSFPSNHKLNALIGKLRSNNKESLKHILKLELPKLFTASRLIPKFNTNEFIDRTYRSRNLYSHGGRHSDRTTLEAIYNDTMLLTVIYLMLECHGLGFDVRDALNKFCGTSYYELPFNFEET